MRKLLSFLILLVVLFFVAPLGVRAETEPELVFDYECQKLLLTNKEAIDAEGKPICNMYCNKNILYDIATNSRLPNIYCKYGSTDTPLEGEYDLNIPLEPASSDMLLIYIRGGLYALLGLTGLGLILFGLYGWYLRAMSEGNPDKIEESVKIYKNAIIGAIIIFLAGAITQVVFRLFGVTEGVFDMNFIPKSGYSVNVRKSDIGRLCYSNQIDKNGEYKCVDNKWTN